MQIVIQQWLEKTLRRQIGLDAIGSVMALLLGVVVLFMTFWITYGVVLYSAVGVSALTVLAADFRFRIPHHVNLVISAIFMVLLFIGNATTCREYLADLPQGQSSRRMGRFRHVSLAAAARMITDLLYTGPRLLGKAFGFSRRTRERLRLDCSTSAWLLEWMLARNGAVLFEEMGEQLGTDNIQPQLLPLRNISGIVFLEKGLTATPELRQELRQLK